MIDIVIVNYNYGQCIIPLLNSLVNCQKSSLIKQKIIVVDNGSADGSDILLNKWFHGKPLEEYLFFALGENRGYAKAVNFGANHGTSKYIMLLNSDMLVLDNLWKEKFLKAFKVYENTAVVGCKLIDQYGKVVGAGTEGTFQKRQFRAYGVYDSEDTNAIFNKPASCINVCGACYMIKRHIFNQLKGFDEDFFMYYEEELFSIKVQKLLNMKVMYIPYTKFLHYSGSHKSGNENKYQKISSEIFIRKCKEIGIEGVNP